MSEIERHQTEFNKLNNNEVKEDAQELKSTLDRLGGKFKELSKPVEFKLPLQDTVETIGKTIIKDENIEKSNKAFERIDSIAQQKAKEINISNLLENFLSQSLEYIEPSKYIPDIQSIQTKPDLTTYGINEEDIRNALTTIRAIIHIYESENPNYDELKKAIDELFVMVSILLTKSLTVAVRITKENGDDINQLLMTIERMMDTLIKAKEEVLEGLIKIPVSAIPVVGPSINAIDKIAKIVVKVFELFDANLEAFEKGMDIYNKSGKHFETLQDMGSVLPSMNTKIETIQQGIKDEINNKVNETIDKSISSVVKTPQMISKPVSNKPQNGGSNKKECKDCKYDYPGLFG